MPVPFTSIPSLDITGEVIKRFDSGKYSTAAEAGCGAHCETGDCRQHRPQPERQSRRLRQLPRRHAATPPATQKPAAPAPAKP